MDNRPNEFSTVTFLEQTQQEELGGDKSWVWRVGHLFRRSKLAFIGAVVVLALVVVAILAPQLAPHEPNAQDLFQALQPPAWHANGSVEFLLGSDQFGRDILSRIIYGARVTLVAAFFAALLAAVVGTLLGLVAGYWGGRLDMIVMRLVDVQLGFPLVLLALTIVAVLGANLRNLIIAMAITGWMVYTRVIRAAVLSLKEQEFIEAARAIGATNRRIILVHILPNVLSQVLILLTLEVARMTLMEASLSYLGLGVPPPTPSWGRMLSESREYMVIAYWIVLFPGIAIMLTVLGVNFMGDGLRDALDPTLQET